MQAAVVPVRHRGTQESDFILGGFAEVHLADFGSAQLDRFEALLECAVMRLLRAFALHRNGKN
jgi:succinate dehydrogenase flavin-adding protein (antitoxin of CptAB toxin-antitoxin module)